MSHDKNTYNFKSGYIVLTKTGIALSRKENDHIKTKTADNYGPFPLKNIVNRG